MPTAAMEASMTPYSSYMRRGVPPRAASERAILTDEALVARASAAAAVASAMATQNEKMLEGLRSLAQDNGREHAPARVDYIARNRNNVGPDRPTIGRKEQRLIAQGQAMAAATAHLGDVRGHPRPTRTVPIQERKQSLARSYSSAERPRPPCSSH